ncbi:phosphoesterase [Streptomyces phage Bartholomune]|nr:phosphoesterase [Streptomyces phage Bartholomune]WNM73066.1 phosphoesterase [Streptomyces phage Persimmon]
MRVMVLGDTHGFTVSARRMVDVAKRKKVEKIVQVGDFGYWPHESDGTTYLDALNEKLRQHGLKLYFVGGNHENWDWLDWHEANAPKTYEGFTEIRTHIRYTGRQHRWMWDHKWFQAVGGAVSIDKQWRTAGKSWWKQESIPVSVVTKLENAGKQSDYLFTHDAPSCVPMSNLKPDADSAAHRQLMDRIGRVSQPTAWFHGHYHKWMEYSFMHQRGYSFVYGLDMQDTPYQYVILDTEENSVETGTGKKHML